MIHKILDNSLKLPHRIIRKFQNLSGVEVFYEPSTMAHKTMYDTSCWVVQKVLQPIIFIKLRIPYMTHFYKLYFLLQLLILTRRSCLFPEKSLSPSVIYGTHLRPVELSRTHSLGLRSLQHYWFLHLSLLLTFQFMGHYNLQLFFVKTLQRATLPL